MSRKKQKNSITYRGYFHLPSALLSNPDFINLTPRALKLLIDLGEQYNGHNNGDLSPSFSLMRERNWNSRDQLNKAKKELLEKNWIIETRQGGLNMGASLYAITWQPIHDCNGKLDIKPTLRAPRSLH